MPHIATHNLTEETVQPPVARLGVVPWSIEVVWRQKLEFVLAASVLGLILQLVATPFGAWWRRPTPGCIGVDRWSHPIPGFATEYLLYLPDEYGALDRQWPLLVLLHGSGERGAEIDQLLNGDLKHVFERRSPLPAIVLIPHCAEQSNWQSASIAAVLDEIAERWPIDRQVISLFGYSMGAFGGWRFAAAYPDRLAALATFAGGGDPTTAAALTTLPIWVGHGTADDVVSFSSSQAMVDAVNSAGGQAKFLVLTEGDHQLRSVEPHLDEIFTWLTTQVRPRAAAKSGAATSLLPTTGGQQSRGASWMRRSLFRYSA